MLGIFFNRKTQPDLREIVQNSGFFNPVWYAATHAGARTSVDALDHYMHEGLARNLSPGPDFNSAWYRTAYPESAGKPALIDYLTEGRKCGRQPSPLAAHRQEILETGLFDPHWYIATYKDAAGSPMDPLSHYAAVGAWEHRQPGPGFNPDWYLAAYPDVRSSGYDPVIHFARWGRHEGRHPTPHGFLLTEIPACGFFGADWYRGQNPDVAAAGVDPFEHFVTSGIFENRAPGPDFDPRWYASFYQTDESHALPAFLDYLVRGRAQGRCPNRREWVRHTGLFDPVWYLSANPDVAESKADPLFHYDASGRFEHRSPGPDFDAHWYVETNPDVARAGVDPMEHYVLTGRAEGRLPNPEILLKQELESSGLFDPDWYFAHYPEVKESGLAPVEHFQRYGWAENFAPGPDFDPNWYLKKNPDVAAAGQDPLSHYLLFGIHDGRAGSAAGWLRRVLPQSGLFDAAWYSAQHPEVKESGLSPLEYYVRHGWAAYHAPCPQFDPVWYLGQHADVRAAGLDAFDHYLHYGRKEKRIAAPPPGVLSAAENMLRQLESSGATDWSLLRAIKTEQLPIRTGQASLAIMPEFFDCIEQLDDCPTHLVFAGGVGQHWLREIDDRLSQLLHIRALLIVDGESPKDAERSPRIWFTADIAGRLLEFDRLQLFDHLVRALQPQMVINRNGADCWEMLRWRGPLLARFSRIEAVIPSPRHHSRDDDLVTAARLRDCIGCIGGVHFMDETHRKKILADLPPLHQIETRLAHGRGGSDVDLILSLISNQKVRDDDT